MIADDAIRAALAEALMHHSWCTEGQPMVSVTGAVESRGQCNCLPARQEDAANLLPTVRRLMQQQAAEEETGDTGVWIDPARRSGEPCVGGSRVPVEMVADTVWAHGIDEALTQWPHLSRAQVLCACWYVGAGYTVRLHDRHSNYAPWRGGWVRRWGVWAQEAHDALWTQRFDDVADPPRAAALAPEPTA